MSCLQAPSWALWAPHRAEQSPLDFYQCLSGAEKGLLGINVTLICPLPHTWRQSGVKYGACLVRGWEISHTPPSSEWGPALTCLRPTSWFQMLWTPPFSCLILIEDCLPGR